MKQPPQSSIDRAAKYTVKEIYPLLLNKVENKGRTKNELNEVIKWLTGYSEKKLNSLIEKEVTLGDFFKKAKIHPNAHLITGMVCGYRVEEVEDPFMQQVKWLDKLVDELAKGRKMEKILRSE
ncbi:MAG: hypothetical protein CMO80_05580 [Verrucomicrobiales bacterium]|nr:hypothetical protein [Verrucomicrobiales bacterium]|tara:strand:+ start:89 stop:457 length:369 start_codon:yes stop_codon:yes gene_type:complete